MAKTIRDTRASMYNRQVPSYVAQLSDGIVWKTTYDSKSYKIVLEELENGLFAKGLLCPGQ